MQRVNKDSVAIQFSCIAMAIITLIPFGRGNISGLEIAFPFMLISVLCFLLTKRKKNKQSVLIFTFFSPKFPYKYNKTRASNTSPFRKVHALISKRAM